MVRSDRASRYRFVIVGLVLCAHFAFGLSFVAVAPVLPLIREDHSVSFTMGGLLVGVIFIVQAVFGLPAGIIVGRLGVRRTYTISLLLIGMVTLTFLSPSFEGLMALRIVYALGAALMIPATAPLIMRWFRPRIVPVIYGLNISFIMLGFVVSSAATAPLASVIGWERVLGLFGAVGLGVALAWVLWGKTQEGVGNVPAARTFALADVRAVLGNRIILLLVTADAACFIQYFALSGWLPTFYNETRGWSLTQGGFVISLLPFMGIFAVLVGGFLPMKIGAKRLLLIVPGAMVGLGGLGSFLIENSTITYLAVLILGVGSYIFVPAVNTMPMELPGMTPNRVAIVWGWINTVTGIGAFISPLAVGAIRDTAGTFIPGFLIFTVIGWWLFISGFLLPKTGLQKPQPAEPSASTALAED